MTASLISTNLVRPSAPISWPPMICGLCTISLVLGTAMAYLANGYPKHQTVLETLAGFLLIGGLGMLGYALEAVFGQP
jgi:hypothetical protein